MPLSKQLKPVSLQLLLLLSNYLREVTVAGRAVEAQGLMFQIKSFQFLLFLLLFERILSLTANLSDLLQAEHLNYAAAASLIKTTKETMQSLRYEAEWEKV